MSAALRRLSETAPGVWVARSRFCAQNSTVVLDGHGGALVIDPAYYADELAAIPPDLEALGVRAVGGVSTHRHYDHVLWHPDLGDVPRWATPGTVRATLEDREDVVGPLRADLPDDLVELAGRLTPYDGELLEWSGPTVRIHVHDAHAPHHLALELPELGVLVAGDMLSDVELPLPQESGLAEYAAGLDALTAYVRQAVVVVPGHGHPAVGSAEPMRRWRADRRYIDALLAGRDPVDPRTALPGMRSAHAANLQLARR